MDRQQRVEDGGGGDLKQKVALLLKDRLQSHWIHHVSDALNLLPFNLFLCGDCELKRGKEKASPVAFIFAFQGSELTLRVTDLCGGFTGGAVQRWITSLLGLPKYRHRLCVPVLAGAAGLRLGWYNSVGSGGGGCWRGVSLTPRPRPHWHFCRHQRKTAW